MIDFATSNDTAPLPRRILMTADTVGGVWTYSIDLARGLAARGIEIALATMGAPLSADQQAQADAIENLQVFESRYKLEWMDNCWDDVATAGRWLLHCARQFGADLVHLGGYAHAALPWDAPSVVVAHSCVPSWWQAVKGAPAPAEQWAQYNRAVREGLSAAHAVVAPSTAMAGEIERLYAPPRGVQVIPNGREMSAFRPLDKQPMILSAGRMWDPAKNVVALVEAAPQVAWPIFVAGDAAPAPQVHMLGRLDPPSLAAWMGRSAIYALPARYEPFGLSIVEAAACGCALVLGDIPSLRENWSDAAVFVGPDDAKALGNALQRLIRDGELRHRLASSALQRARRFQIHDTTRRYLNLYSTLLTTPLPTGLVVDSNPVYLA